MGLDHRSNQAGHKGRALLRPLIPSLRIYPLSKGKAMGREVMHLKRGSRLLVEAMLQR